MCEGTSGFCLTEREDGSISIGYANYGVSIFGGSDFEMTYALNAENAKKFITAPKKEYQGSTEEMIEAAFSRGFKDSDFREFCKKHDIRYSSSTRTD